MEQVLLLAKNAKGLPSVVDLVSNALALPDLFVFGELLDLPAVQQLRDKPEFRPWYAALELFAYGTWNDYARSPEDFPNLSEPQKLKLKQLTAVTTAQAKHVVPYGELKAGLNVQETRDLEDFLINHCFYCGIVKGKLDQAQSLLVVEDCIRRDVRLQDFPCIRNKLQTWFDASERSLDDILQRIVFTRETVEQQENEKEELKREAERRMHEIRDMDGMRMDASDFMNAYGSLNFDEREAKSRRGRPHRHIAAAASQTIKGKCYVTKDNIDTDQIIPAEYLTLVPSKPEEYAKLGSYAMIGLPDELYPKRFVRNGSMKTDYAVIVGGQNFGCGSSREHAPVAIGAAGSKAVIAESYARIFFRNCIATGELYPVECEQRLCDVLETDMDVELNLEQAMLTVPALNKTFQLKPLGEVKPVVDAGGIFEFARQEGLIKTE